MALQTRPPADFLGAKDIPDSAHIIELPVCTICGTVGKQPGPRQGTFYCKGPAGELHRRSHMRWVRYEAA